jgi:putative endonuclease
VDGSAAPAWTVYVIECADGSLYTGITTDLDRRLAAHEAGRGAKYTRGRGPFVVRYTEAHATRGLASKREAAIKALDAAAKRQLRPPA